MLYGGPMLRRTYDNANDGSTVKRFFDEQRCPEIELMKAVLAAQLKDYLDGIRITEDSKKGREVRGRAKRAKAWIEDRSRHSTHYIFGFEYICKIIAIDPGRLRKKILLIQTIEDVNEIKTRYYIM
ncbi:unnamed protein product [marine sediment metagenome]|uniref:Uncharacterized protein n=1 Tax=marine sediment metagenome TaxID=412755 RepID=X1BDY7_9ZZZZ